MEDRAIVVTTSNVSCAGIEFVAGVEKEIPMTVARKLGNSAKILKTIKSKVPKAKDVKAVLKGKTTKKDGDVKTPEGEEQKSVTDAQNTAVTGKEEDVKTK